MFLSYSRGSLVAAGLGAIAWFAFVPLRLRSLPVLLVPGVVVAPVLVWALGRDEFTKDGLPAAVRANVGPEFGLILWAVRVLLLAFGLAIGFQSRDWIPSFRKRKRAGVTAGAVALAIPLVLLTSVAVSSRGLPGTVSDRWSELTSESATTPGGPQRLIRASSTRGRYWRQAGKVYADLPVTGSGMGTFGIARLRYRKDQLVAQHAHGFIAQTAADLGTLGLLVILAFAGAWFISAARTTGLERDPARREGASGHWDADRVATTALALAALVYALQSAIDWTWFVPGPTIIAILLAGYVAGRGPAPQPAGMPSAIAAAGPPRDQLVALPRLPRFQLRLPPRPHTARLVPALLVVAVALCAAWAVYQPQRADHANDQALDLLTKKQLPAALEKADRAHSLNPSSLTPLWTKGAIYVAQNNPKGAEVEFQRAVFDQPSNPEAWTRLAEFELYRNNQPQKALEIVEGALYLDPRSAAAQTVFFDALRTTRGEP
jgi:tetratricopeptide (TPR) repeat protein